MAKAADNKFGWVIKDISSLSEKCCSVPVLISDCRWRLVAFPKGNNCDHLSLYLDVADFESLPCGWRNYVKLRLTVVNQLSQKLSILKETEHCFDGKSTTWGFPEMLPLSKLHDKDGGFLVNREVMIVAEVDLFEVLGTMDASDEASKLLSKKIVKVGAAESNDLLKKTSPVKQINDVNGTKQVENSVKSRPRNKLMWTAFLFFLFVLMGSIVGVQQEELLVARKRIFALEKLLQK